jgi:hypothetical protein
LLVTSRPEFNETLFRRGDNYSGSGGNLDAAAAGECLVFFFIPGKAIEAIGDALRKL